MSVKLVQNARIHACRQLTFPKTGWAEGVLLSNQSRNALWFTLMKNWLPPDSGRPVLAIDKVPGALVIRWWSFPISSAIQPPAFRRCMVPSHAYRVDKEG
jgi:hypothetical protein